MQSARLSAGGGCNRYLGNAQIDAPLIWGGLPLLLRNRKLGPEFKEIWIWQFLRNALSFLIVVCEKWNLCENAALTKCALWAVDSREEGLSQMLFSCLDLALEWFPGLYYALIFIDHTSYLSFFVRQRHFGAWKLYAKKCANLRH